MLAYVFWHRPRTGVEAGAYEEAQRGFHASLEVPSACFRIEALPFGDGGPAYEDWYLVEDWAGLGELNATAVDAAHRAGHDAAASLSAEGWAAVLALVEGPAVIPAGARWLDKPRNTTAGEHPPASPTRWTESAPAEEVVAVWQRQLVLGPAPEFCLATRALPGRAPIAAPTQSG